MESQHEGYRRVCEDTGGANEGTISLVFLRPTQKARPFYWNAARRFEVCLQLQRPPLLADEPLRGLVPQ